MRFFSCLLLSAVAVSAFAEANRTMPGVKLAKAPKIDGVIDPAEWGSATKSGQFVHLATGEKISFDAEVFVGYDAENIYFAFNCPDPDPKLIRATEYRRNASLDGDDHMIILLNLFGTHQQGDQNQFFIGAGGGLKAQFAGGRASKREWEGAWDAKSRITEKGWECELVVPWKILRTPPAGTRDIEVNFARVIPRMQTAVAWCDIGPNDKMERNGSLTGVEVPVIKKSSEILALPYQIVGYDEELKKEVFNTGIDLRYEISPQISSLATINPDFQNVEGAVLNLSFSRFERLAEERRPFFVEGSREFQMGGMSAQLFAPQRLGGFDLGAKAFGKLSDTQSFGAMVTTHFEHDTAAVARFRQTWGNRSYATAGVVHWDNQDLGIQNTAIAADVIDWRGNWGGDVIYNSTSDNLDGNGHRLDLDIMFSDSSNFASFGYQEISAAFLPRIGFAPQRGFEGYNAFFMHNKEYVGGPLSDFRIESYYQDSKIEGTNDVYLRSLDFNTTLTTRGAMEIEAGLHDSDFMGSKATILGVGVSYPDNNPYQNYSVGYSDGRIDGEDYSRVDLRANYRFPSRITVTPMVQFEKVGSEEETLKIIGLSYEINRDRSIGGRLVERDGKTNWYVAFRKSGNLGAEWFVIIGDPNAETFQKKLIVKAVFPFTLRI